MRLTQDQIDHFDREGWLIVEGIFDPETDFAPLLADYSAIADRHAPDLLSLAQYAGYDRAWTFERKMLYLAECTGGFDHQPYDISLPPKGIDPELEMYTGEAAFRLLSHPRLLDVVECFIGSEIYSNPVQHVRVKVPERKVPDNQTVSNMGIGNATLWHQDNGVITEDGDITPILTCWAPVTDASVDMGCLAAIPRSHRLGLAPHCLASTGLHIPTENVEESLMRPLPMAAGSVLFLHRHTLHRSLPNVSDAVRFSFDLRYSPTGLPTGREVFPGFVARSRLDPASELHDADAWSQSWRRTQLELSEVGNYSGNRYNADAVFC